MSKPVLYHQQGCGMCRAIEMLLNKKGIEFESVLVTPENVDEVKKLGVTGTPALIVDGQVFVKKECKDWVDAR